MVSFAWVCVFFCFLLITDVKDLLSWFKLANSLYNFKLALTSLQFQDWCVCVLTKDVKKGIVVFAVTNGSFGTYGLFVSLMQQKISSCVWYLLCLNFMALTQIHINMCTAMANCAVCTATIQRYDNSPSISDWQTVAVVRKRPDSPLRLPWYWHISFGLVSPVRLDVPKSFSKLYPTLRMDVT